MQPELKLPAKIDATYLIAVSGGVDSVALLHLLTQAQYKIIVAHFEHGIRPESEADARFVEALASNYGLEFKLKAGNLGPDASEEQARDARYAWLRSIKEECGAQAIITAHHQDDVLETLIMNIQRGTKRHGLSSLASTAEIVRPLLGIPKAKLIEYALENNLEWVQDESNTDSSYSRNNIRMKVIPKLSQDAKTQLLEIASKMMGLNSKIDSELEALILKKSHRRGGDVLPRLWFISLDHTLAQEVVLSICRKYNVRDYSQVLIDSIALRIKTTRPGRIIELDKHTKIELTKRSLRIVQA